MVHKRGRVSWLANFFEDDMNFKSGVFLLALVTRVFFALPAMGQQVSPSAVPPIPIDATEEQVRQAVSLVRAGQKLTPKAWPNGARVAVCLSFDVDNELLWRRTPW